MTSTCTIVVDRQTYEVEASEGTARARHGDLVLELPHWSAAQHLDALRRHLVPGPTGLELDSEAFAAEVLACTGAPVDRWGELVPLALWWAARPEQDDWEHGLGEPNTGWTTLHDGVRARLHTCTWHQRIVAARHGLVRVDGSLAIDPVQVLEHLLTHVVEQVEDTDGQRMSWRELASSSLLRLANVVLEHNSREAPFTELGERDDLPEQARGLLELCRVLGRTPTQVLGLPATEVDLVRELMRRTETAAMPRPSTSPRAHAPLHMAPDAIVLDFGGGEA